MSHPTGLHCSDMHLNSALLSFKFQTQSDFTFDESPDDEKIKIFVRDDDEDIDLENAEIDVVTEDYQHPVAKAGMQVYATLKTILPYEFMKEIPQAYTINRYHHVVVIGFSKFSRSGAFGSKRRLRTCVITINVYETSPHNFLVSLCMDEMANTCGRLPEAVEDDTTRENFHQLVNGIDKRFNLGGKIEVVPVLRRGRLATNNFMRFSDGRLLEYDFDEELLRTRSNYQDIRVLNSPSLGRTLLLDNRHSFSECDRPYIEELMDIKNVDYRGLSVLVLGGGDGGVLFELVDQYEPKSITLVEIDPEVVSATTDLLRPYGRSLRPHYSDKITIIYKDCTQALSQFKNLGLTFDVIINDLSQMPLSDSRPPMPGSGSGPEAFASLESWRWRFIESVLNLSFACLKEGGVYMTQGPSETDAAELNKYEYMIRNSPLNLSKEERKCMICSQMETKLFYSIRRKRAIDLSASAGSS